MSGDTLFRGPSDLHTHSRVSDGTESPSRLVREAAAAGLGTVALTDHDSTAGWHEAGAEARQQNITFIPGMEFSTRFGYKSVHLLAYLFDPLSADLVAETARIRESRLKRAESIVRRIGVDDQFGQSGKAMDVLKEYGLTAPQIAENIKSKL